MTGHAAEQIIAGVVLSERLAVTMYGAIHRAQFEGQRNLRGLVVDPKMLAEDSFRRALTDASALAPVIGLEHATIVPTFAVEAGGPDVVVVTRGVGRYVTVQDVIAASRANRGGGKLSMPVAAAIGRSVVEALAVAHAADVVHGAVHPRSVLLDQDGAVRLGDFVVGRALTTAIAQGADASLWKGLAGFVAPELVVGDEPTPAADVFAVGALLFTMLSGEVPPGPLHVTPAVERLVQRALDSDLSRRYRNAAELLENLLEAFEDDRWEIAERREVIEAAGLSRAGSDLDEATEDLLASLGDSAVQVTPMRPSIDIRAEAVAALHTRTPTTGTGRLDALLADLDDAPLTQVDDIGRFERDPISELIATGSPLRAALAAPPPAPPTPQAALLEVFDALGEAPASAAQPRPLARQGVAPPARPNTRDEHAAMDALADLEPPGRAGAREAAPVAAAPVAAARAPVAADHGAARTGASASHRVVSPHVPLEPSFEDLPPPRLRSRAVGIVSMLVVVAGAVGFYVIYQQQRAERAAAEAKDAQRKQDAEARTRDAVEAQPDKGTIAVKATPPEASIWLKLGRTSLDTLPVTSSQMHRIRLELEGYQPVDTEVLPANWSGTGLARKATVNVTLKALARDSRTGQAGAEPLPARPPNLAVEPKDFTPGEGPLHIETSPPGAEVWLLIGYANTGVAFPTIAGRAYELRALSDGYKPGYAQITADEWRDGGSPSMPIDVAPKKALLEKHLELIPDPAYVPPKPRKRR